jgi:RHH-type rel operon transcriptional repressor/antitoxin RelB
MENDMISLRLDPEMEQTVKNAARQMGVSKSELIRTSIKDFITKMEKPTAWELGGEIFGKYASEKGDLSTNRKALVREKVSARR